MSRIHLLLTAFIATLMNINIALAITDEEKLARKSGCFKCHKIDEKKKGPAYREIAEEYRNKPGSLDKIYDYLLSEKMVEVEGKEKKHKKLKTEDPDKIKAVILWIFSL
jgi:cytochrome c